MAQIKISELIEVVEGVSKGNNALLSDAIEHLLTDSRTVVFSEGSCFFSIITAANNGHNFIQQSYNKGIRCFVVSEFVEVSAYPNAIFIEVKNTLIALQQLGYWHRKNLSGTVIGITGSNGKTVVKEWLYQVLSKKFLVSRSPKSFNSQIGVPLALWKMDAKADFVLVEAGISEPGEMDKLSGIIRAEIVLVTNIGEAHQQNFEDKKQKAVEKLELAKYAQHVFYCENYGLISDAIQYLNLNLKQHSWDKLDLVTNKLETEHVLQWHGTNIELPFTDKASVENMMHCIKLGRHLGLSMDDIKTQIKTLEPVAMRLELIEAAHGCTLINDAYNSDFQSLSIALDFLNQQAQKGKQFKTIILSDFVQVNTEYPFYDQVFSLLEQKGVDRIIGVGEQIYNYCKTANLNGLFFPNTNQLLQSWSEIQFKNEAILLKGARSFGFEQIAAKLEVRSHQTQLQVNLQSVVHNFKHYKNRLKSSTKMMAMVKAFAYGSGSFELARLLQYHGCDYLAVAVTDEGVSLRQQGIELPIMVLSPNFNTLGQLVEYNLEPEIYQLAQLKRLKSFLNQQKRSNYPIHIKIDTGMHRLGFNPDELDALFTELNTDKTCSVTSIFSHLSAADESQYDSFTLHQLTLFKEVISQFRKKLDYPFLSHILNTAGQERFSEYQFDMVRLGIGLYGVSAVQSKNLRPVATFKTNIIQLNKVSKEDTVGYGRKGKLEKDSLIATIPVGYADGLDRRLGNGVGTVVINGNKVPFIGNICMDLSMVDVTGLKVKENDVVEIFGMQNTIQEVADSMGTIPYEVISRISQRVKRVYVSDAY